MIKKQKKGISLIVLVITIIVVIILAGSIILSLSKNNPINDAIEASFKTSADVYKSELNMAISSEYLKNYTFNPDTFNAGVWDENNGNITGTIKEYITSITSEDGAKYEIQGGKLVYVGTVQKEKDWLTEVGIVSGNVSTAGVGVNVIVTENTTVNGAAASYNNPIIPKGFKAVNDGAVWPTGWNEGLVIEDASGNQFVWVPIDGTNVTYTKWCATGILYNDLNLSDDTVPSDFNENSITTKYKGFYIARYESMFDYNGGNIRVASKKSINKATSIWTRDSAHTGYLWNFVNYTDAKIYAENMATRYGYDTLKVGTNLITGAEWDTAMKWIQNSGKSVTESITWGNHSDSTSPANVSEYASLQISGFSNYWKAMNIYDLSGNTWEWTNEIYASYRVNRGGSYRYSGSTYPAASRDFIVGTVSDPGLSFRVVLYVL